MKISDEKTMFTYSHLKTFIEQCQWIFQTLPQSTTDEEIMIITERKRWQFIQQSDFAPSMNLNSLWFQMTSRYDIKCYTFTSCELEKKLSIRIKSRYSKSGEFLLFSFYKTWWLVDYFQVHFLQLKQGKINSNNQ